jgi:small-conductance mechanosensitive channel
LELENADAPFLAKKYADAITQAIRTYRGGRGEAAVEHGFLKALMLTGIYLAFVIVVIFLRSIVRRRTTLKIEDWGHDIEEQSGQAVSGRQFLALWRLFASGVVTIIVAVATYYYVALVLGEFGHTKWLAALLLDTVAAPVVELGQAALGAIPNMLTLFVIFVITRYLLQILRLVFDNIGKGVIKLKNFDRAWSLPTFRIIRIVIIIFAVVVGYPYIPGSGSDAFKGISLVLGVLVSLGANSVASNLLGGIIVIYKRSIKLGDLIKVGDTMGYVERVGLLDTDLRSLKNELVSIPNSVLTGHKVVNLTRTAGTTGLLLHTTVGIGYEEPRQKIERLLIEAAVATPGVKAKPGPFVLRTSLNGFDVTYEINAYMLKDSRPVQVYSALHANILDCFNEAGVQIMTPSYVADPAEPKIAPPFADSARSTTQKAPEATADVPPAASDG